MKQHNLGELRRIAVGAVRSEARRNRIDPAILNADDALCILDDLQRRSPYLLASLWYNSASDNQIKLFRREWRKESEQKVL